MSTLAIVSSQLADLFTFVLVSHSTSVSGESNGLVRFIYEDSGAVGVILFKLLALVVLLWAYSRVTHPTIKRIGLGLIVVVGLLGALTNTIVGVM